MILMNLHVFRAPLKGSSCEKHIIFEEKIILISGIPDNPEAATSDSPEGTKLEILSPRVKWNIIIFFNKNSYIFITFFGLLP